eukprot:621121-Lingulodinium_polyedra.AAC.1
MRVHHVSRRRGKPQPKQHKLMPCVRDKHVRHGRWDKLPIRIRYCHLLLSGASTNGGGGRAAGAGANPSINEPQLARGRGKPQLKIHTRQWGNFFIPSPRTAAAERHRRRRWAAAVGGGPPQSPPQLAQQGQDFLEERLDA